MLGRGLQSLIPPSDEGDNKPQEGGADGITPPQEPRKTEESGGAPPIPEDNFEPRQQEEGLSKEEGPKENEPPKEPENLVPSESARMEEAHPEPPSQKPEEKPKPSHPKFPDAIFHIEVDKIKPNPDQPRRNFDETGLKELAASIREFGLLQPVVVTKKEREVPTGTVVEYELISGERRLMACKILGLERIPAIIRNVGLERERLEMAVIENIQREDLNPIEMARAMARLQDEFRLTQREIAVRLGKSREVIANTTRLLDLPVEIQKALEEGKISESHGRLLLTVEDPALQQKLFRDLVEHGLSTRELKNKVRIEKPKMAEEKPKELSPELKMLQEKLSSELGAPVKIQQEGASGKITINFYSEEELKHIIDKLGGEEETGF